ncbi:ATP synthase subunit s, mitochondrial [Pseudolycoriella hygida]|uniref:ATP synthase subunit s, mitochondrial n=1 Tax=Pseudolycoriella hygida TaxID=35572 RepID=A0A9Q0N848_9DIPT|nr:ATP synthase subunit s, mitochondrial [Pseudolycoriella hygida]
MLLKIVGPDRLCAEWVLKNGGFVRFENQKWTIDYNALPAENYRYRIEEVDGTKSTIMAMGFDHFQNCTAIRKVTLKSCRYMENEALEKLGHLKESLCELEINGCYNVVDEGLQTLKQLTKLKKLSIENLPYVKNMKAVEEELQAALTNCVIEVKSKVSLI